MIWALISLWPCFSMDVRCWLISRVRLGSWWRIKSLWMITTKGLSYVWSSSLSSCSYWKLYSRLTLWPQKSCCCHKDTQDFKLQVSGIRAIIGKQCILPTTKGSVQQRLLSSPHCTAVSTPLGLYTAEKEDNTQRTKGKDAMNRKHSQQALPGTQYHRLHRSPSSAR